MTIFQQPGEADDELEIEEDDPVVEELKNLEIFADDAPNDEAPNATDEDRAVCPYCDKSWSDKARKAHLTMHLKFNHKEEQHGHVHAEPKKETKERKTRTDAAPRGGSTRVSKEIHDNVEFFYNMAGSILSMKDPICGGVLSQVAPKAADAWVELAKTNAVARKFWSGGAATTGWLQLAMAHVPLVMIVQGHHVQPRLEARQRAFEADMMEHDEESIEDLAGRPVVYTTEPVAATVEGAFVPEGAGPGFTTSDLPYEVGENGFTESAFQ